MIKVSIITPVLNGAKTIRQTIESVWNQTYKNIEYIIIDGCSTDSTPDIIKEYLPLFGRRIKYVREPDRGIYNAMNKGIRMSSGKLIGIINSDDYYEITAIENVVKAMEDDEYQLIYGYCRILGKGDTSIQINRNTHEDLFRTAFMHPTCFVTRKTYCRYGLFVERYKVVADCDLLYRLYRNNIKFVQVKEILANYRIGGYSGRQEHDLELAVAKFLNGGIGIGQFIHQIILHIILGVR